MSVWLVVLEDRHTDVQIDVFACRESAIEEAKDIAADYEYAEKPSIAEDGKFLGTTRRWILDIRLNDEGDYVRVEEVEVHP